MLTIFRLTVNEVLRRRIFLVVTLLTVGFLIIYGIGLHFIVKGFQSANRIDIYKLVVYPQLLSMGLYFATMIVALLTIFTAVGTISGEIDSGVLHSIVPKPLKRKHILWGKYLGYGCILFVYSTLIFLAVIGLVKWIAGYTPGNVGLGWLFFILLPLILLALTVLGSTFLSTMANGVGVFMLYSIGTIGGMLEQFGVAMKNTAVNNIGIVSSLIIPTDAIYRKMITAILLSDKTPINALTSGPFGSQHPPSTVMIIYSILYLLLALWVGKVIFEGRDI